MVKGAKNFDSDCRWTSFEASLVDLLPTPTHETHTETLINLAKRPCEQIIEEFMNKKKIS